MIRMQIVEKHGAKLISLLKADMRNHKLQTFTLHKRGYKVVHDKYPGWMNWSSAQGVITCEVLSPQKPGSEWQFLSALIGRLAHKYKQYIISINVQIEVDKE